MQSRQSLLLTFAAVCALTFAGLAGGCTLDFDQFETPAQGPDAGSDADDENNGGDNGNDVEPDAGPDADAEPDADGGDDTGDLGELGASCEDADDCVGDVCRGSVCLAECQDATDCPAEAGCFQIGSDRLCAPRCGDRDRCEGLADNADLSCATVVETRRFGANPHRLSSACLPDTSADGVFDGVDNCPDEVNPTQRDSTGDGVGDACSDTPQCHVDATDGVLDYGDVDFRPGSFVTDEVVDGRWLPVVGTVDAQGEPDSSLVLLDRESGEWREKPPLEFAGDDRYVVDTNTGGVLVSPGESETGTPGEWARISATGDVSYGPDYRPPALGDDWPLDRGSDGDGVVSTAPMRFSNGQVEHLVYAHETDTNNGTKSTILGTALRDADLEIEVGGEVGWLDEADDQPGRIGEFDRYDIQTLRHPDGATGVSLWHPDQSTLYLVDLTRPATDTGVVREPGEFRALSIPEQWSDVPELPSCQSNDDCGENETCVDTQCVPSADVCGDSCGDGETCYQNRCVAESDVEDLSDFDPVVVPAPSDQLYVFDRNTGRAGRFRADHPDGVDETPENLFARQWGDFERLPAYDLDVFQDFADPTAYLLPDAPGFGLVGHPSVADDEDPAETVTAQELYFHCLGWTGDVDTDGDGVGDIVDNCPDSENAEQPDLDGDGRGDACDADVDGDGTPNGLDVVETDDGGDGGDGGDGSSDPVDLSRDSDNDETPNDEDGDVDGDGVGEDRDPFFIDSSNDGLPNRWTDDASANGFGDDALREAGLDPYYFFSLPVRQKFVYLVEGDDGGRSLYRTSLSNLGEATELPLSDDLDGEVTPHDVTFGEDSVVYALAGPPGETNRYVGYDIDEETPTLDIEFEEEPDAGGEDVTLAIRSISWIDDQAIDRYDDETAHVVVHQRREEDGWMVSETTPGTTGYSREGIDPVNDAFDHFWHANLHTVGGQEVLLFVAAESDCQECASVYLYWFDSGEIELVDSPGVGFANFSSHRGSMVFESPQLWSSNWQLHHYDPASSPALTSTDVTAGFDDVTDLARVRYLGDFTGPSSVLSVTASRWGQSSDLWLYVPTALRTQDRWRPLITREASIVETAWQP